jgi:hypothetical protein
LKKNFPDPKGSGNLFKKCFVATFRITRPGMVSTTGRAPQGQISIELLPSRQIFFAPFCRIWATAALTIAGWVNRACSGKAGENRGFVNGRFHGNAAG